MTRPTVTLLAAAALWLAAAPLALAHGLLVSVRGDGQTISGRVYYSNGEPGAGEWVQLSDLTQARGENQGMAAGPDGAFSFAGVQGHSYRVTVTGEEGHSIQSDITLAPEARGRFVEQPDDAAAADAGGLPPAWALLGGLLVASLIPALWLRSRGRRDRRPPLHTPTA